MERVLSLRTEQIKKTEVTIINREFRIKISRYEKEKRIGTSLVGISGLIEMLGITKTVNTIKSALQSKKDVVEFWAYKHSIKIQFYRK